MSRYPFNTCQPSLFLSSLQNAIVPFKELCGLSAVANLKQCILALSPRLTGADSNPLLVFNLKEQYPSLEPQGLLPEVLKKVVTTYDMVSRGGMSTEMYCYYRLVD